MRVRVLFFGVLKDAAGRSEDLLEVAPGATIASVFDSYRQRFGTLDAKQSSILFARNEEFAAPDTPLSDNDEIAFLPPVSGGTGGVSAPVTNVALISITRDVIDANRLARLVQSPEDGAVVTFEGVVRNNTRGRQTLYLEYESYETMALRAMERIAGEIGRQFAVGKIAIVHRLGRLEVGEASVAIAVSAPHRRPAFQAALETIDRLKREVPIWKKEFFADGEVWVEGEWDERLQSHTTRHAT